MKKSYEDMDDMERCRAARDELNKKFKTVDRLFAFLKREEKKSPKNIAMGKRLLAQRDAELRRQKTALQRRKPAKRRSA